MREHDKDSANLEKYSEEGTYTAASIVHSVPSRPEGDYAGQLLWERFSLLKKYLRPGILVDLCCGNGCHLAALHHHQGMRIGVDYTENYLKYGQQSYIPEGSSLCFVRSDARKLPLAEGVATTIYSFSALYTISNVSSIVKECYRILAPDGIAVFDFGNRRSLNYFCCRYYPEAASVLAETVEEHLRQCREAGFHIVEHRSFQFLPLWCTRPKWLLPLLHPYWSRIMAKRFGGKMLDELISGLPIFRQFSFRHLVVCRKEPAGV
jgi:ubiquinone/menaquinone biosynthesis C-methylase UbiE